MQFLTFLLHGSMAAWGEVAYGPHRPTRTHPTRSSVLGLVAAGLGIGRDEPERQRAFNEQLGIAVCTETEGTMSRDYHTAQTVAENRKTRHATRREQLSGARHDLVTILSTRDYVHDALYTVAMWNRSGPEPMLPEIERALREPFYAPFLGRRSCPPAWPFAPRLVEAPDVVAAIDAAAIDDIEGWLGMSFSRAIEPDWRQPAGVRSRRLHADVDAPGARNVERTVERRDVRHAWDRNLFTMRDEIEMTIPPRVRS